MTGKPVVHGVHVFLAALELWMSRERAKPVSVQCTFSNPVSVGDNVVFVSRQREDGRVQIEGLVAGLSCCQAIVAFGAGADAHCQGHRPCWALLTARR